METVTGSLDNIPMDKIDEKFSNWRFHIQGNIVKKNESIRRRSPLPKTKHCVDVDWDED